MKKKLDGAIYSDIKVKLPGMDVDQPYQTDEPMSLDSNNESDSMDIIDLKNLTNESAQSADDLEMTHNTTITPDTSDPEIPMTGEFSDT